VATFHKLRGITWASRVRKTESKPNPKPNTYLAYPNAKHYVNPKRENTADRNLRRASRVIV